MRLKAKTKEVKNTLVRKATPSELAFMNKLVDAGYTRFIFQKPFEDGDKFVIADFYLQSLKKVVIEVDGGYHFAKDQLKKDLWKDKLLLQRKEVDCILRLTAYQAHNISSRDLKEVIKRLKKGEVTCLYNR